MEISRRVILAITLSLLALGNPTNAQDTKLDKTALSPKELATKKASQLAINSKTHDPFGLHQDPHAKPKKIVKSTPEGPEKIKAPKIALAQEILKLKTRIQGIGPNKLIIRARLYKRGNTIKIVAAGKTFTLEILRITSDNIIFRNLGDKGIITLDMKRDKIFDSKSGSKAIPLTNPNEEPLIELK